jgi:predicted RNA-binding Zn-ribbon protein involved in translation (DUF1610 family)
MHELTKLGRAAFHPGNVALRIEDDGVHLSVVEPRPIPMVLHCPHCGRQHIDRATAEWANPPHRSHLCHFCGTVWRPADVPTTGVSNIETSGKQDNWKPGDPVHPAAELTGYERAKNEARLLCDAAEIMYKDRCADGHVEAIRLLSDCIRNLKMDP